MKNKPKYKKGLTPSQIRKIQKIKVDPLKRFILYASEATITHPDGTVIPPKRSKKR